MIGIVAGGFIIDRNHNHMPSGVVRAYAVRNGVLIWYWDPIPPGETHEIGPTASRAIPWHNECVVDHLG